MSRLRVVFIGCVEFSHRALRAVLAVPDVVVAGVVTRAASPFNADHRDLSPLAEAAGVPVFLADREDGDALAGWIAERRADVVYCFGWSSLLGRDVLAAARLGVVGFHPAALPDNRGRHPLIWALVLGLDSTASTFFFMDEGADTGDILSQEPVPILPDDDAAALYDRVTGVALRQIGAFSGALAAGTHTRRPQPPGSGNAWRKRSRLDGRIDWRMTARAVFNLVRALARPYPGAHCEVDGAEVKVWRCEVVPFPARNIEPGKVVDDGTGRLLVKCGEDAVALIEHDFAAPPPVGAYL